MSPKPLNGWIFVVVMALIAIISTFFGGHAATAVSVKWFLLGALTIILITLLWLRRK